MPSRLFRTRVLLGCTDGKRSGAYGMPRWPLPYPPSRKWAKPPGLVQLGRGRQELQMGCRSLYARRVTVQILGRGPSAAWVDYPHW